VLTYAVQHCARQLFKLGWVSIVVAHTMETRCCFRVGLEHLRPCRVLVTYVPWKVHCADSFTNGNVSGTSSADHAMACSLAGGGGGSCPAGPVGVYEAQTAWTQS
jgi:hypothetical protein